MLHTLLDMSIAHLLTTSAKNFGAGLRRGTSSNNPNGEFVRHAPTGDPRLDLAHAERSFR